MYKRNASGWTKHLDFIVCDALSLIAAFFSAYAFRFGFDFEFFDWDYQEFLALVLVLDVAVSILFNTMHNVLKRDHYREASETLRHGTLTFIATMIALVSLKTSARYSRLVMYGTAFFHLLYGYGLRIVYKKYLLKHIVRDRQRSMLVVANEADVEAIVKKLERKANQFFTVTGVVLIDRDAAGEIAAGVPVVANLDDAAEYILREWVDEVFLSANETNKVQRLMDQCREMGVVLHTRLMFDCGKSHQQMIEQFAGYTVITSSTNAVYPFEYIMKRMIDIAGGLVGCILTVFVVMIVGPMIKKASPGPIFYTQERIGLNGKRFKIYKIRSMVMDADARKKELSAQNRVADGMMFKLDFDPRIIGNKILADGTYVTGIGDLIRRTSLDEFPQFFNVLKGDMSLVGTRPPTVDEWEKYKLHHRARLAMRPGITGLWQVSGRSNITDFEEIVRLDTQYICNWSLFLDIRILIKTVRAVLFKKGAM
ncbi:MAG: sugar transferase [Clostridia bacterium]|nr:sugar transferase [Clostridia bacterium]